MRARSGNAYSWSKVGLAAAAVLGMLFITVNQHAFAGIATTKHNLGSTGTGANHVSAADTAEICVFCHTPHGSNTAMSAPLWNKGTPAPTGGFNTYSTANSTTIDGMVLAVGSVSLACLSCHDGTQAMDNMINAPGSGGYNATGARALNGAGNNYTWSGAAAGSGLIGNGVTNIGSDLTNDHPIGIEYCGGGISGSSDASASCKDPDFKGFGTGGLQTSTINGARVWWIDTTAGTNGSREKTDIILYSRDFTTAGGSGTGSGKIGPSVECASCHDPHTSDNPTFLRVANNSATNPSGVCLSCHVK